MTTAAVILALTAAAPAGDGGTVQVAPLRTALAADVEVGRRGVGWTCFPAGAVRWRDLSFDAADAAQVVARSLADRGIAAEVMPSPGTAGSRPDARMLSGTIDAVTVKACSPYGFGKLMTGGSTVKGRATLTVTWTFGDGAGAQRFVTQSEVKVSGGTAGYRVLLAEALARAASDAADRMRPPIASR